jgi:N6-adenosine-specific RNA methylase IME4
MRAPVAETRPIAEIRIGARYRRDLGDVDRLAASIASVGLLHPPVITPSGDCIAGVRRLEACKQLGWIDVPVRIVDLDEIVRGSLAENSQRKDFLPTEIDAIRRALEPIEKAAAKGRMSEGARVGKISTPSAAGKTRDKIGAFAGVSGRTVAKIAAVCDAGRADPKRFGQLLQEMDHRGVDRAYRALLIARDEERILNMAPVAGKYRTLVLDPPWPCESDFLGRGAPKYALMTRDQILALPVAQWADDRCHLYLWATNASLPFACECLATWGFAHKSVLTWVKPRRGLGAHFRNTTEHVLFGMQGRLPTRSRRIATHFEAPVGEHSAKPDRFYEIVRAASFPPCGEAFQRKARPGFENLYQQKLEAAE